jgi:hypothetical protein
LRGAECVDATLKRRGETVRFEIASARKRRGETVRFEITGALVSAGGGGGGGGGGGVLPGPWQAVLPKSVYVPPASGTKLHS